MKPDQMEYKIFKPQYLEEVTGGDPEIRDEIVTIFKEQIPEFVTEMKQLLEKKMFFELGLLAHKAKSSVAIMGMDETANMLKTLELQAKKGESTEDYTGFVSRFENDTTLVLTEIDHYLREIH